VTFGHGEAQAFGCFLSVGHLGGEKEVPQRGTRRTIGSLT